MGKTIAEHLREEGRQEGREVGRQEGEVSAQRRVLVQVLRHKFGKIPAALVRRIEATEQLDRLNAWLVQVMDAKTLGDVSFAAE